MVTLSGGYRRIRNVRASFWDEMSQGSVDARFHVGQLVSELLRQLEARLRDATSEAVTATLAATIGRRPQRRMLAARGGRVE